MWQSCRDTWARAQRSSENLLQSVMGYMDQHMRLYTLALEFAAETLQGPKSEGLLRDHAKRRILRSIVGSSDYVGGVMELDVAGRLVRSSNSAEVPGMDSRPRLLPHTAQYAGGGRIRQTSLFAAACAAAILLSR